MNIIEGDLIHKVNYLKHINIIKYDNTLNKTFPFNA